MSAHEANPLDHPEVRHSSALSYISGYLLSIVFMAVALILTLRHTMHYLNFIIAISILAGFALLAQALLMFRLDLSKSQQWKAFTLILVLPLFVFSIGLTGWMFHTLYPRTMMHFMQVQGADM
jgi:heme/copper-type cytochrome/quinol oxidase subunit 4